MGLDSKIKLKLSHRIILAFSALALALIISSCGTKSVPNPSSDNKQEPTTAEYDISSQASVATLDVDVSGDYRSEHTGDNGFYTLNKKQPIKLVMLRQNGNKIKGKYGLNGGEIEGSIVGNTIKFKFYLGSSTGNGKWKIDPSGNNLVGKWFSDSNSGKWNLLKLEAGASASLVSEKRYQFGRTKLHLSVIEGNQEKVEELVSWGANVNARTFRGRTPYSLAIMNGHADITKYFQEKQISIKNNYRDTNIVFDAAIKNNLDVLGYLQSRGADFGVSNSRNENAIHMASSAGSKEAVGFLLKESVNPSQKTDGNLLPVHYAALSGKLDVLEMLIDAGAKASIADKSSDDKYATAILYEYLGDREIKRNETGKAKNLYSVSCLKYSEASASYEEDANDARAKISDADTSFILRFALATILMGVSPQPYATTTVSRDNTLSIEEREELWKKLSKDSNLASQSCQKKVEKI